MAGAVLASISNFTGRDFDFERRAKQYLRQTHSPETLIGLSWTRPPRGQHYTIIDDFYLLPEKRLDRAMAPCPVCSPRAPKYYCGSLAWFPSEQVYRCIGRECATHHIGTLEARLARKQYEQDKSDEADFEFAFDNLGSVPIMITCCESALERAIEIEKVSREFGHVKDVRSALASSVKAHDGRLVLYERRWVERLNVETSEFEEVAEHLPHEFGVLDGAMLLRGTLGFASRLRSLQGGLREIHRGDRSAAEVWAMANQQNSIALRQCRAVLGNSTKIYARVLGEMQNCLGFFTPANFERLAAFGRSEFNTERFNAYSANGEFHITITTSRAMRVRLDTTMLSRLPSWPELIRIAAR